MVGLWGLLVLVSLSTYVWRAGGVAIAARIKPDGNLSQWFSCVAYGMLAAESPMKYGTRRSAGSDGPRTTVNAQVFTDIIATSR